MSNVTTTTPTPTNTSADIQTKLLDALQKVDLSIPTSNGKNDAASNGDAQGPNIPPADTKFAL